MRLMKIKLFIKELIAACERGCLLSRRDTVASDLNFYGA